MKLFNRFSSLFLLIIISPILIVIAILIKKNMPNNPIIFKQKRIGKDGKIFIMYKFRTMIPKHSGSSVSVKGESRITPLGEKLRKYKLDELPELWNVFIGDMSFVGPRPDVPGYADRLEEDDKIILSVKPGITGPASLKYRKEEEILALQDNPQEYNDKIIFPDKIRINKNYIKNRSFRSDLEIIICTILGRDLEKYY